MKPSVHKKHSSTLCILPTALMVEEELKRIARESGLVTGYRVMTFPELMNILSNDFSVKQRQISSIGELLLIKDAADAVLKDADDACLSPIKDSPLFYRSLYKFIRELRQAIIGSKDFEYAVKPVKNKKYSLLASIYSSYEKSLSSLNLTDDIGRQWSILKGLEDYAGLPPSLSNIEKIVIDGFYDLTQIQRKLVKAFIDKGIDRSIIPIYSLENPDA
ncbi:MAG: hypothetical protein HZB79_09300, partial [Deltaproteobacteria bacterium]|nr:hypothetical protein [Deltaproteobacteria bacterium]